MFQIILHFEDAKVCSVINDMTFSSYQTGFCADSCKQMIDIGLHVHMYTKHGILN